MEHDQFFTFSLSRRLDLSHAVTASSCVMNLACGGAANFHMNKSEGSLYNILR